MQRAQIPIQGLDIFTLMARALAMQPLGNDAGNEPDRTADARAIDREPQRGWLDRLDHWFWKREQRAVEAYLATASDIYDLEVKIRELERGARPWGY